MNYENAFKVLVMCAESVNRAYKLCNGDPNDGFLVHVKAKLYAIQSFADALGLNVRITYNIEKSRNLYIHSISMTGYLKVFY